MNRQRPHISYIGCNFDFKKIERENLYELCAERSVLQQHEQNFSYNETNGKAAQRNLAVLLLRMSHKNRCRIKKKWKIKKACKIAELSGNESGVMIFQVLIIKQRQTKSEQNQRMAKIRKTQKRIIQTL